MRTPRTSQDPSVERLRWMLIAAITGAAAAAPACAGRSQSTGTAGDAGDGSGGTSATGGSGGKGTGGSSMGGRSGGGTAGRGAGGTGGNGGAGGVITPAGGVGGSDGGIGGTAGRAGAGMGGSAGRQPDPEGCAAATSYSPTLWSCEGGFVHRPVPGACPVPDDDGQGVADAGAGPVASCEVDAHCDERPNGRCVVDNPLPEVATSIYCIYACAGDADCAVGQVCSCEGTFVSNGTGKAITIGVCRPGTCGSDGDCAADSLCISPVYSFCGTPRPNQYHCQTPADECRGPEDCDGSSYCEYQEGHFVCMGQPTCGRPFLIDGEMRQAPLARGLDWAGTLPELGGTGTLTGEQRAAVARHFAGAALMEHASIAAFARFSLQLLALGAPSDLVMEAARAMADETRHARLCFGLAERYGLRSAAPGALDVAGALGDVELLGIVEMVTLEGCIGESAAALEAAWAAEAALDPVVKDALAGIAEDEARHAALAFRFVAWAAQRDPRVLPRVTALVAAAQAACGGQGERPAGDVLEAHGVLDAATRRAARAAALRDVIPAALAGLAAEGSLPRASVELA
jgi:hypothetical protein